MNGYINSGINFELVINSPERLDVTRRLARWISETTYIKTGVFLESLTDQEVIELNDLVDHFDDGRAEDLVLIVMMLSMGEGLGETSEDTLYKHIVNFIILFTYETLHRKGAFIFDRDSATLDGCV